MPFDYSLQFRKINFRKHPELYRIGKGEQGVLLVEPYKSEMLPHWTFKTEELATKSAKKILTLFNRYKRTNDFVGMDMARKFLQMGFTRARRYANHRSGKKYVTKTTLSAKRKVIAQAKDWNNNEKAKAAKVFYKAYIKAKTDKKYLKLKAAHQTLCQISN